MILPLLVGLFFLPAPAPGPAAAPLPIDRDALAGLVWAATVDCPGLRDDTLRRQCLRLQALALAPRTFTMVADAGALERSDGVLVVRGCLACAKPLDTGRADHPIYVVTGGSVSVAADGPKVLASEIARLPHVPADALEATISFTIPGKVTTWSEGGVAGIFVDLAGYAVTDRCDGKVVAATPSMPTPPRAGDPSACAAPSSQATSEPAVPYELSFDDIRRAMADVEPAIETCHDRYGVPGSAEVYVALAPTGRVKYVEVRGDFADTPSGECVAAAVRGAQFPQFRREAMQIHYSFSLR